jgi:hypothetical protein
MVGNYCPQCQQARRNRLGYCTVCGSLLELNEDIPIPTPSGWYWYIRALVIGIVALVLSIIVFLALGTWPPPASSPTTTVPVATTSVPTSTPTIRPTDVLPTATLSPPTDVPFTATLPKASPTDLILPSNTPTSSPTSKPVSPTATIRPTPTPQLRSFVPQLKRSYSTDGSTGEKLSCIIGKVQARNGRGIPNAVLYANNGITNTETFTTDANGDYSYCKLGVSPWSIVLTFIPQTANPSKSALARQAVMAFVVNGTTNHIAAVDFIEQ